MAVKMILRSGCVALGLLAGLPALAQNAPSQQPPPGASRPAAAAPTVHRQPRAADVTAPTKDNAVDSPLKETPEDAAMNRMIRSICRGC